MGAVITWDGDGGLAVSQYDKCSSASGLCRTFNVTVNGVQYCSTGESCNTSAPGGRGCNGVTILFGLQGCWCGECASHCVIMGCSQGYTLTPGNHSCVCAKGYYSNSSNDCVQCPDGGTTANIGSSSITACYIPSGTTGSDSTGTYKYMSNCYY